MSSFDEGWDLSEPIPYILVVYPSDETIRKTEALKGKTRVSSPELGHPQVY